MPEETLPIVSNAFGRLLSELSDGDSLTELSAALRDCVQSARNSGKATEIVYSVKFTPKGNAIFVTDKIVSKIKPEERPECIFFPTEEGTLQRNDPKQKTFDLREVEKPQVEIKEVSAPIAVAQ